MGSAGTVAKDGETGIGLPTESVTLKTSGPSLKDDILHKTNRLLTIEHSETKSVITASVTEGETLAFPSAAYIDQVLYKSSKEGIPMREYTHVKISFDIERSPGVDVLPCTFYLSGLAATGNGEILYPSIITIHESDTGFIFNVRDFDNVVIDDSVMHFEYIIKLNHDDLASSQVQIFVNGKLIVNRLKTPLFYKFNVEYFDVIRVLGFQPSGFGTSSITFSNLEVKGYNE